MIRLPRAFSALVIAGFAVVTLAASATVLQAAPAAARPVTTPGGGGGKKSNPSSHDSCNKTILGIPAWYNGLADKSGSSCNIASPSSLGGNGLQAFILRVALNVVTELLVIVGYVCVIFIIYGGFKYYFSTGSSDGMSKAKQTIMNALIGLVISFLSVGIVNAVIHIV